MKFLTVKGTDSTGSALNTGSSTSFSANLAAIPLPINERSKFIETDGYLPATDRDDAELRRKKLRLWKNLIALSFSFFLLFNAYHSLSFLQSSLNSTVGTASLFAVYIAYFFSSFFVPSLMMSYIGEKWSLILCECGYLTYIAVNLYPIPWMLITSALILGTFTAPLWTIQACLITEWSNTYAQLTKQETKAIISRFFGIFSVIYESALMTADETILRRRRSVEDIIVQTSTSLLTTTNETFMTHFKYCGARNCPGNIKSKKTLPLEMNTVYLMISIYIISVILGIFILIIFLKKPKIDKKNVDSFKTKLFSTVKMFRDIKIILLIPLISLNSVLLAFMSTDISKAFIACIKGIEYIGLWFVVFGITAAIFSFICGYSAKYIGRIPLFVFAFASIFALHVYLLVWDIRGEEQVYALFIVAVTFGIGEAVWANQINSVIGTVFYESKLSAFSNYRLISSFTSAIAFAYSGLLCVRTKLYIILGTIVVAAISFSILEIIIRAESAKEQKEDAEKSQQQDENEQEQDDEDNDEKVTTH